MAIGRADETDLLLPLHDGVHEARLWQTFLARLRQRVRADVAGIAVETADDGAHWFAVPAHSPTPADGHWRELRLGRVYPLEGGGFGRIVGVDEPAGARAWLAIRRTERDFTAADGALLARLAPHLAIALRTRATLDRMQDDAMVTEAALGRAGIGWVAFAADGHVLAVSRESAGLIGDRPAPQALVSLVIACAGDGLPQLAAAGPTGRERMLLVPIMASAPVAASSARVMGLVRLPGREKRSAQAAALAALFGLAPSEARLALAVASGASLIEAAGQLGLTIETARNYSKRVFAKTRTRGQADLVRAIMSSVAWLA